jgi:DNA-binding MarR family transcriptional regulator
VAPGPAIPEIDVLIHEPARLRALALLAQVEEADFMYLLRQTGLSRGNLSVQMSKLEQAGIVGFHRQLDGARPRTTYFLTQAGRRALEAYRHTMARLLAGFPGSS